MTRISEVYELQLPTEVQQLLEMFDIININVASLGLPLQCIGLGEYEYHLASTMFAPVVLAAAIVLGSLALPYLKAIRARDRLWFRRGKPKEMLLEALPWLLLLLFLVSPLVSSAAFRAFACEEFDSGQSYLRADYAVECSSTAYARVELLAWLGILLFPVGVSMLYAMLILLSRRDILDGKHTSLSRALGFLVRGYRPEFMWWELLVLWRQLYLVGFALLVDTGSVEQLVISFLAALGYMLFFSVATPFKKDGDNYFGQACSFALVAGFFFLFLLKVNVLTASMHDTLSEQLRDMYHFEILLVTAGLVGSILLSLLLAAAMACHQIVQAARVPTIRLQMTKASPDLSLAKGHTWHLFLSHIWGTGQDQCATIKRQLTIMLPGASIFLDVDDLRSIDALEGYIEGSQVIATMKSSPLMSSV